MHVVKVNVNMGICPGILNSYIQYMQVKTIVTLSVLMLKQRFTKPLCLLAPSTPERYKLKQDTNRHRACSGCNIIGAYH